jgi:hypothetical protein
VTFVSGAHAMAFKDSPCRRPQQAWSNETGEREQRNGLAPVLSKLSVKKGPTAGVTQVTITGLNFKGPDVTSVKI